MTASVNEIRTQFLDFFEKNGHEDCSGYRVSMDGDISKVWVYSRQLRHFEKWNKSGKTGEWITDKIEDMPVMSDITFSEKGMARIVNGSSSGRDCVYVIFASRDLSTYYIMGYVDVESIRKMNLTPQAFGKKDQKVYSDAPQ